MTNGFKIIGISCRTTNKNNQSQRDLGELWNQFYAAGIMEKIPAKNSATVLSVYTDYESDFTGAYTVIIGVPVNSLEHIPAGLTGREFGPENFRKFIARGKMPDAVVNTWMEIWQNDQELRRKYSYDFESYGPDSQSGENAVVEIYIATF